jgi:hypothetical protein
MEGVKERRSEHEDCPLFIDVICPPSKKSLARRYCRQYNPPGKSEITLRVVIVVEAIEWHLPSVAWNEGKLTSLQSKETLAEYVLLGGLIAPTGQIGGVMDTIKYSGCIRKDDSHRGDLIAILCIVMARFGI